jgi:hypothetical protein
MEKILTLLTELESAIPAADSRKIAVSQSCVGWHIEHTLLVINTIMDTLRKSDSNRYKWKFNLARTMVQTTGKIPRGRAQAPTSVVPPGAHSLEKLQEQLLLTKKNLLYLQRLPANSYFRHPYFGDLNVKPATRFLFIHTLHHLKIIRDILRP